jgi:hypothetical protein
MVIQSFYSCADNSSINSSVAVLNQLPSIDPLPKFSSTAAATTSESPCVCLLNDAHRGVLSPEYHQSVMHSQATGQCIK